ncbi:MAG: pantoate--beta-alanine ligase [Acidobacteria bacterium]|nr:pantoate--beta-alanine ligase [Acidobacteriota bacterium]MCG2817146.1 pantoate--beta-alanine ligase [Candidatus Aminicenantes bacterium]MBU1338587.1 pantoate--beta-alanine ligase [Acidobacteriota bacterium]MBU1475650.1 pantoate--beta-alanine ligase [Acidobacteriota bacterium]MBU2437993.1 pantoate--beta-alanine ligase [Acidobacteriota bacterium]
MNIIHSIEEMKAEIHEFRKKGKSIGCVPTMGSLHEGHLSLVRQSLQTTDRTVVTIFINPAQFAPGEDFEQYPRDYDRDIGLLEREGVDIVFLPDMKDIYPPGYKTYVEVHDLQERLCGLSRPTFFRGVCTIVLKLFNIITPDRAFFGQKDAQQAIILQRMVRDLNLDILIEVLPIVRDADGLALSSRNAYLKDNERKAALTLSRSLRLAEKMIAEGERSAEKIREEMIALIQSVQGTRIDYIEIVDSEELLPLETLKSRVLVSLAVFIGRTRLIDNTQIILS